MKQVDWSDTVGTIVARRSDGATGEILGSSETKGGAKLIKVRIDSKGCAYWMDKSDWEPLHDRPWNGTGMPPVGTVCEARHEDISGGEAVRAEILKHHENGYAAAFFWIDAPDGYRNLLWAARFTPIRTPEQIAAEERNHAIGKMLNALGDQGTYGDIAHKVCAQLHDAGYRLQEQPK